MQPPPIERPSLKRRLAGNYAAQMLDLGVRIAQQVLLVPVLILGWGVEQYADWLLLAALAGLMAGIDFGLSWHFANRLHQAWVSGDLTRGRRELRVGLTLLGLLVPVLLLLGLAIALLGPVSTAHEGATFGLLLLSQSLMHPRNLLASIYRAHGHYGLGIARHNLITLAQALALAAVVLGGAGLFWAAASQVLLGAAGLGWLWRDIGRRFGSLPWRPLLPDRGDLRTMVETLPGFTLAALANVLWVHGPILLLKAFAVTAETIISFSLLRTLAGLVRQLIGQLALGGGVEMADHQLRGDAARPGELLLKTNRLLTGLGGMATAGLIVFAPALVGVWTHGHLEGDRLSLSLLLAGVLLASPVQAALAMPVFLNRPWGTALATGISALGGLTLAALLYPLGGLPLFMLALAAMEALGALLAARWVSGVVTGTVLGNGFGYALLGIACAAAVAGPLSLWSLGGGALELALHLGLFTLAMVLLTPLLLLNRGQRLWLRNRLRQFLLVWLK